MANLYSGVIENEEFKDLSELTGVSIATGTKYLLQPHGTIMFCASASKPVVEGTNVPGFALSYSIGQFKLESGEKAWVCVLNGRKVPINLSK